MIVSVHIANVGVRDALSLLRRVPKPSSTPGLRSARAGLAAPLGRSVLPKPSFNRIGLVAFWDDDGAIDKFEANDERATILRDGFSVRLEPLRAFGTWPGLDDDVPRARRVSSDGTAVVLTLGKLRLSQSIRFFRTSARAEAAVVDAPGLLWATGFGRPPFVATCSFWENQDAIRGYAFDRGAHSDAITRGEEKPFHHQQAFIRFRPYAARGSLTGNNPLPPGVLDA